MTMIHGVLVPIYATEDQDVPIAAQDVEIPGPLVGLDTRRYYHLNGGDGVHVKLWCRTGQPRTVGIYLVQPGTFLVQPDRQLDFTLDMALDHGQARYLGAVEETLVFVGPRAGEGVYV